MTWRVEREPLKKIAIDEHALLDVHNKPFEPILWSCGRCRSAGGLHVIEITFLFLLVLARSRKARSDTVVP